MGLTNNIMRHWAPLWSMIVDSSLWSEPDFVCKVFVTMLALKDSDDIVRCNSYQLAQRARKTESEVLEALKILSSPDTRRVGDQEFEGRRIKSVEEGWLILNGEKYREMVYKEMQRARWRRAQQAQRDRKRMAILHGKPLPGEMAYVKEVENGSVSKNWSDGAEEKRCLPE